MNSQPPYTNPDPARPPTYAPHPPPPVVAHPPTWPPYSPPNSPSASPTGPPPSPPSAQQTPAPAGSPHASSGLTVADSRPTVERLPGPDVVRALAMLGVVTMNYIGYMVILGGDYRSDFLWGLFDPWQGPLSTRFAATFVITAGVGVTLMTNRFRDGSHGGASTIGWRLARRGLLLYGVGLVFDFIWPGTILPYYGAMFLVAIVLWRLPDWALATIGVTAAIFAWWLHHWVIDAGPGDADWLVAPGERSPAGLVYNVFVNGTHPLFPWLAFFCAGIIVGRHLRSSRSQVVILATGFALWLVSIPLGMAADRNESLNPLLSSHPFDRGIVYTASALGTGLIALIAINAAANQFRSSLVVDLLRRAGQMSLTIYLAHALVFNVLVTQLEWVHPPSHLIGVLAFALLYWLIATAAAIAFQYGFGRGPAEWVYRRLTN